jgi:hypothetical protein
MSKKARDSADALDAAPSTAADAQDDAELVAFLRGHHIWCTARDGRFERAANRLEELALSPVTSPDTIL